MLAIVGLLVVGPDRLPALARDAARMLRRLSGLAQGARAQLRDELGLELVDVDLRDLNPRTAIQQAVLGDDLDLKSLNPRRYVTKAILGPADGPQPSKNSGPSPGQIGRASSPNTLYDSDAT